MGIYLSVWAIRYKADWDYKLSPQASVLRWSIVFLGYFAEFQFRESHSQRYASVLALYAWVFFAGRTLPTIWTDSCGPGPQSMGS